MKMRNPECVSVLLASIACMIMVVPIATKPQELEREDRIHTLYGLMYEEADLRIPFYGRAMKPWDAVSHGSFLLVAADAPPRSVLDLISTNECPTVASAMEKRVGSRWRHQLRLVKRNAVFQTPLPRQRDLDVRSNVLAMTVDAGDVLIVTYNK